MKITHYLTATIQKGNRLEINLPALPEGENVEVILIVPENKTINDSNNDSSESTNSQYDVIKTSLAEHRQMLAEQAEAIQGH